MHVARSMNAGAATRVLPHFSSPTAPIPLLFAGAGSCCSCCWLLAAGSLHGQRRPAQPPRATTPLPTLAISLLTTQLR